MSDQTDAYELQSLATRIIAAHVANNTVDAAELPTLIRQVHEALASLDEGAAAAERPQPMVPIKKSITANHIVCLEDGKKLKMLKRHLMTSYNLTPEQYRERWGLPADYPMVAPNYAAQRSALAKKIGLGTRPRKRKRGRPARA